MRLGGVQHCPLQVWLNRLFFIIGQERISDVQADGRPLGKGIDILTRCGEGRCGCVRSLRGCGGAEGSRSRGRCRAASDRTGIRRSNRRSTYVRG